MDFTTLSLISPEIFVTIMASCMLLIACVDRKRPGSHAYLFSLVTLIAAIVLTWYQIPQKSYSIFSDGYIVDRFASILKIVLNILLILIFICSRSYMSSRKLLQPEFFALSLFSLLGMMIVISCGNFLTLYLGLELLVLPLYAMIVLVKHHTKYTEAAMKYFVIGSLGAGLLLYGISLIYGASGSIGFAGVAAVQSPSLMFRLGLVFILVGIALEFGAVPFHMWLPDVYEGSPTTVTMIIGTLPKVAVLGLSYRVLSIAMPNMHTNWQAICMVLALLSIAFGNILAIAQTNFKRMLAYSTISHVGFILLGLFAAAGQGYSAATFYAVVYAFMALTAFALIMSLSAKGFEADNIEDFRGLSQQSPWHAFLTMLTMFALAGTPPLVGFYAKFLVLQAVVAQGFPAVAALALFFTVIGAFYYLRVIKVMYFDAPTKPFVRPDMTITGNLLISLNGVALLFFGLNPAALIYMCVTMLQ